MSDHETNPADGTRGVARRRFLRTAAATAVAFPAVAAMSAGRAAAGVAPENPLLSYRAALLPFRCYDSRWTSKTGGGPTVTFGRLSTGQTRTVSVWPEFSTLGSVAVYERVGIPASTDILAVTFNLTVVATLSNGNLSVGPGGSVPTSSHVNWFGASQALANAGTVRIDPGEFGDVQTIEVRAGGPVGSSTHFIVDVTGWYEVAIPPVIV